MMPPTNLIEIDLDDQASVALGPIAVERACNKIVEKTGEYMTAYTLFVSSHNIGLALKIMAVCTRIGVVLDEDLGPYGYKLVTVTPKMQIVIASSKGGLR